MRIGIPKEKSFEERRVALAPAGVDSLIRNGHVVLVESGAGDGSHFSDSEYSELGAQIVHSSEEIFQQVDCVLKVNPISFDDAAFMREGQIVFSFLHLAVSDKRIIETLNQKKVIAIGYELIENESGLPVLQSMSEIAGQLSVQVAERFLESSIPEARGVLLGGLTGVAPAAVVILGAGVVGTNAARAALGRGASVIILDTDLKRLRAIDTTFQKKVTTVVANPYTIRRGIKFADVLIGAILIKADKSPHIVSEEMVKSMKKGAVLIDCSIDQGGCVETSRPTTISDPVFVKHGVIHYCVPNMPAIVARTASYGLTNAAIQYVTAVANEGINEALLHDQDLARGVCTFNGFCSNEIIAEIFNLEYRRIHIFSTN